MDSKKQAFLCIFFLSVAINISGANFINALFDLFSSTGDNELDRMMDEHDKLARQKRQEVTSASPAPFSTFGPIGGYVCPTELFRRMDKCCKLPQMYPNDVLNKCSGKNMLMALPKGPRKNIRPVQLRLRKNYLVSSPKNASIKSRIEDICKAHCIFKTQRWLAPENYIDEQLMWSTMILLVPPGPYQTLLYSHTRTECSGISGYGDFGANVTNMYGQKCMIAPFRMLRCIKKSFLLAYNTCPGLLAQNQQCDLDKNYLKLCDTYAV